MQGDLLNQNERRIENRRTAKILIVDDIPANLLSLEAVLASPDLELVKASSGLEALEFLRDTRFAAVLLDVQMPQMDGLETARQIRTLHENRNTPILFLTANDQDEASIERSYKVGGVDLLMKPLNPTVLKSKVAFFIELFHEHEKNRIQSEQIKSNLLRERDEVLESALDAVVGVDEEDRIIYWNQHAEFNFGWTKSEALGQDMSKLLIPERYRKAHTKGMEHFLKTGEGPILNKRIEVSALKKDGTEFPIELTVTAVKTEDGFSFYSFLRDISTQNRAKQTLQESEERTTLALQASKLGFWDWNLNSGEVVWSEYLREHWGFPEGKLKGTLEDFAERIHPDDRDQVLKAFNESQTKKKDYAIEYRILKAGGTVWIRASGLTQFDEEGRPLRMTGTSLDITSIKETELALKESELQFRTMANSISQLAWMADEKGWIFWYNQRWFDYTGTTLEEMQGWGWQKVHHPDHVDRVVKRISYSWDTGEPWEDTFPLRSSAGEWRWFLSRAVPVRDSNGKLVRWFGTNTDVTEQLQAQEDLKRALGARDEFLSIASHELKTPVTSLKLQMQIFGRQLAKGEVGVFKPESLKQMIDISNRQVDRLTHLIEDMLDVSRVATGKMKLDFSACNLGKIAREMSSTIGSQFSAAGVTLNLELADGVIVNGDSYRIEQVVVNLLTNALKYGVGKPVWVTVKKQNDQALLIVRDEGMGIAPENLERIFDRFERAISSNNISGMGLGLYISREIVKEHGGKITAESKLGEGSRFTVVLPLKPDQTGG